MSGSFIDIPPSGGGGGGAVDSVNGQTGVVVLTKSSIGLGNVDNTSDANKPISTATQTALNAKQDEITSNDNEIIFNNAGTLEGSDTISIDPTTKGLRVIQTLVAANTSGNIVLDSVNLQANASANSPNNQFVVTDTQIGIDTNNAGFNIGTGGGALIIDAVNIVHNGTSDAGTITFENNNFSLGNGTDPIDVKGLGYSFNFGSVNANVNVSGPIQGHGFQTNINAAATISSTAFTNAFYDSANFGCSSPNYTSFNAAPVIDEIITNNNYNGVNVNANISTFSGNAGYTGVGVFGNLGTFSANSFYQGVAINPNITMINGNATGINVDMSNVTVYAGVKASLVVQDITYEALVAGTAGNDVTVEYLNTTTAGNEVATLVGGTHIQVTIESGVSTATQVLAALMANATLTSNLLMTITGTASDPQVTYAETNLAGGINPGNKKAAVFNGDVQIQGALSFSGGLSIGALNSFASVDISGYPPGVNAIDTLITQPSVPANTTLSTDLLAINTAMLMTVGDNSVLTSSFLGYTALGLPAVVNLGANSTIDSVSGAAFAISLDAGAGAGSSIDNVSLCRAIAIPNGITTITELSGFKFDLPFGDPGTTTFGVNITPACHNYMAGDLKIGSGSNIPANTSVMLELDSTTKVFLNARLTTTQKLALTPLAGMQCYDTTLNQLSYYNGTTWVNL